METRFLWSRVAATSSLTPVFSRDLAASPADSRYCPPMRAELSTCDSGVNDFPAGQQTVAVLMGSGRSLYFEAKGGGC